MESLFCPYEQALALKELGFDEPCLGWYQDNTLRLDINSNQSIKFHEHLGRFKGCFLAPTFSQAFRWFREKYNLNHVITVADFGKYEIGNPDFQCAIYSKDPLLITNMYKYNTYEEAELACLRKLIEIVKQNG